MDNGGESSAKCRICPGRCSWRQHASNPYRFEIYTQKETRTSEDFKKKYYPALEGKNKVLAKMQQIQDFLKHVETDVMGMVNEVQKSMERLDKIALRPDPSTQIEHLDLLIESEKQQAKSGYQQRVQFYEHAKQQVWIMKEAKGGLDSLKSSSNAGYKEPWYTKLKFW